MKSNKNKFLSTFLTLLYTTISAFIGLVIWFQMRDAFIQTLVHLDFDRWKLPAADHFSFLLLGIIWLIFVFVIHHLYTKSVKKNRLTSLFILVSGYEVLLLFVCQAILLLLSDVVEAISLFIVSMEFLIGFLLIAISIYKDRMGKNKTETL